MSSSNNKFAQSVLPSPLPEFFVQIFGDDGSGYDESRSALQPLNANDWQTVRFHGLQEFCKDPQTRLRIDPINRPAIVSLSSIRAISKRWGVLYKADTVSELQSLALGSGVVRRIIENGVLLLATNADPTLFLPPFDCNGCDECVLEVTLKVEPDVPKLLGAHLELLKENEEVNAALQAERTAIAQLWSELSSDAETIAKLHKTIAKLHKSIASLNKIVDSARKWQERSWFKRTFHRWRAPGAKMNRPAPIQRFMHSVRKRWAALLGKPLEAPASVSVAAQNSGKPWIGFRIERVDFSDDEGPHFSIKGWYAPVNPEEKSRLRAGCGARMVELDYGIKRPDVEKEFKKRYDCNHLRNVGFEGKVWVADWNAVEYRMEVLHEGQWIEVVRFETGPTPYTARLHAAEEVLRDREQSVRFNLVLPVFNTPGEQLERVLLALLNQPYVNWRLCILDDGSDDAGTLGILADSRFADPRITILRGNLTGETPEFPDPPKDFDSDHLAMLPDIAPIPPDWLAAWFLEMKETDMPVSIIPAHRFPARRFVRNGASAEVAPRVRALAFFLPQFHEIPENNEWWGEGFTEWTNVRRAFPLYPGHDQPRVPHPDLDYYNLLEAGVKEKQAAMARRFGLHGFCYYFYWFGGRRILEKPLEQILAAGKPDFPFCLCWANENWSRRWDGNDEEVLLRQNHSPEDDVAMIRCLIDYFRDPRYIRVGGKPLFVIYRPGLLPDAKATYRRWREVCRREGIGEIYLAAVRAFKLDEPGDTGLDALIQFPPLGFDKLKYSLMDPKEVDANPTFSGKLYRYDEFQSCYTADRRRAFKLFRGVMPAWDNTPRRLTGSAVFHGGTPGKYFSWLRNAIQQTEAQFHGDERLVFINAWNEWAEGAYLEPDQTHGYLPLELTRRALQLPVPQGWVELADPDRFAEAPVLAIGHDAARAGAQSVLLNVLREWQRTKPFPVRLLLVGDGILRPDFEAACPDTLVLADYRDHGERQAALRAFLSPRPRVIYSNTVVNGPLLEQFQWLNCPVVTHVHELQKSIERWAPGEIMAATVRRTDRFIAVSEPVAENLIERHGVECEAVDLIHAFIETDYRPDSNAVCFAQQDMELNGGEIVVFGCGTTDWRKGPDLFLEIAARTCPSDSRLRFFWLGGGSSEERHQLEKTIAEKGLGGQVRFIGERPNPRDYFASGHLFLLSSREDPFPLVVLEAADAGLPAVCFEGAGGIPSFVGSECGAVVPNGDVAAAAGAIADLAANEVLRRKLGATAREKVRSLHSSGEAACEIATVLEGMVKPLVTIVVPNYNHVRYLPERLESITAQGIKDVEILLLDDASKDNSVALLEAFARVEPKARVVVNTANSGSTFKQWRKALSLAKGKYIWIAESDDSAEPGLLSALVERLENDPGLALAYAQSRMIDENGRDLGLPFDWVKDLVPERWRSDYLSSGVEEIRRCLAVKNTIPNASAVVFRNFKGIEALVDDSVRLCADWLFWVRLCARGSVAFCATPLNRWRLNTSNARTRPPGELELREGCAVIEEAARILHASEPDRTAMLSAFEQRCRQWMDAAAKKAEAATVE